MAYRITRTLGSSVNPDLMPGMAEIGLLSNLEIWVGIIVACMPTLVPCSEDIRATEFDQDFSKTVR